MEAMNRSFLIVLIPALVVSVGYFFVLRYLHLQLSYGRLMGAGVAFLMAVGLVHYYRNYGTYRRRHTKRDDATRAQV